jgi:hypothetical protein
MTLYGPTGGLRPSMRVTDGHLLELKTCRKCLPDALVAEA